MRHRCALVAHEVVDVVVGREAWRRDCKWRESNTSRAPVPSLSLTRARRNDKGDSPWRTDGNIATVRADAGQELSDGQRKLCCVHVLTACTTPRPRLTA